MTRQELLIKLGHACAQARLSTKDARQWAGASDGVQCAFEDGCCAGHYGNKALDHLAALEQQAITDYLADVPLPEGWTEDQDSSWGDQCYRYLDAEGNERVAAFKSGTCIWMKPAHWPAIPRAVLVRAAVQCAKLREQR